MEDFNPELAVTADTFPSFDLITFKEVSLSRDDDGFSRTMRARRCKGGSVPSARNDDNVSVCTVEGFEQILIPQFLVPRVLRFDSSRQNGRAYGWMTPITILALNLLFSE